MKFVTRKPGRSTVSAAGATAVPLVLCAGLLLPGTWIDGAEGMPIEGPVMLADTSMKQATTVEDPRASIVRDSTAAEHHAAEALRHERLAIDLDPLTDSLGRRRNELLAAADSHRIMMRTLRTRVLLSRIAIK